MNTLEIHRDGEDGNTKKSSSPQPLQLKQWFFTWNNYPSNSIDLLEITFKKFCEKYVFQEEVGAEGTPHLQGCIFLKRKMRWTEFQLPRQIHWEKTRNGEAAVDYCQKVESRNGKTFSFGFPKPIKTIENLYDWQKEIETICLGEPDGRHIHWYYDQQGNKGKSAFCKYMFVKHNALVIRGGKLADISNMIFNMDMDNCNAVLIDIPRGHGGKVSYTSIECILDGLITNTKYETGAKAFNPPNLIVFSNFEPEQPEKLSDDRWIIREIK